MKDNQTKEDLIAELSVYNNYTKQEQIFYDKEDEEAAIELDEQKQIHIVYSSKKILCIQRFIKSYICDDCGRLMEQKLVTVILN